MPSSFTDRIISPPMVRSPWSISDRVSRTDILSQVQCRAMALLYIGPLNAPDLHSDYHISPIFTPPHLLHQFPPVYLSCGERDPFVDDTVIFAGKLREAKEARKLELLGKELRHGESLRMSGSSSRNTRDPILDEDEDDWVQSSIIEGWSHGYLQMVSLLPAAEKVISMMGDWIEDAFEKDTIKRERLGGGGKRSTSTNSSYSAASAIAPLPQTQVTPPTTQSAKVSTPSPPANNGLHPHSSSAVVDSDSEKEDDILSFTPKRRRGSSNVSRTASPSPAFPGARVASNPTSPTRNSFGISQSLAATASGLSPEPRSPPEPQSSIHTHLITPVERALRDEYHSNSASHSSKHYPSRSVPSTSPEARPSSTTPTPSVHRTLSDDETQHRPSSAPPISLEDVVKKARSGSAGSLPAPSGAHFVDAKHLLRRRRDEVVSGLSANTSRVASRDGSDHEDEGGVAKK